MTDSPQFKNDEDEAAKAITEWLAVGLRVGRKYARQWKRAGHWRKFWLRRKIRNEMLREARKRPWGRDSRNEWFADSFMDNITEEPDEPSAGTTPRPSS